jgi:hypothetical protein
MKNKITALVLVAVTAFALAPKPAKAGDKELAVVGGLIGGLIIGSAIADSRHSSDYSRNTHVIVDHHRDGRYDRDRGYWKEVRVKVWVPGCWVVERSRYGRDYRRYVDGHYTYRTNRVWVSYDRHDRRGYDDRYDRRGDGRW